MKEDNQEETKERSTETLENKFSTLTLKSDISKSRNEAADAVETEDVVEAEEGKKSEVPEIAEPKLSPMAVTNEMPALEEAEKEPEADFSLLDQLMDFLAQDEDEILPILTGYFNKIVQSLLAKMKNLTLEYLLIVKKGSIFEVLLKHMHHYSLAVLLIELLEQDIKPPYEKIDKPRMAWEQSEGSDDDQKHLELSKT